MKKSIFTFLSILCFAHTAMAQDNQQTDSTPPAQGWVQLTSGTTAAFTFISLVGRDTVYVSGDQILRSTDAGSTWQRLLQVPIPVGGRLQFIDDTTAFLSGASDSVFKTTDGGTTWSGTYTGLGAGILALFASSKNGSTLPGSHMVYTNDGDSTWHSSSGSSGGQYNCMTFADSVHGYGMGSSTYWNNNMPWAPTFERTSNGGATWEPIYPGPSEDANGHSHWGIAKDIYGIAAISIDTLIAVGDRSIARSLDTGNTWDTVANPLGFDAYDDATFPDKQNGWIVAYHGEILHTSDVGISWQLQNSGVAIPLNSIRAVDTLTVYAVGANGTILKTTNAGLSWVNISPLSSNIIQGTIFPQPASSNTSLAYNLPETQHVTLSIQNMAGATILPIIEGLLQTRGIQTVAINTGSLASGTYTYALQTEKYFSTGKIEVIH